jgi:DNA-directed RNA polymerase specialized sigma24 family protein
MPQIISANTQKKFPGEQSSLNNLPELANIYDEYAPALLGIIEAKIGNKEKSAEVLQLVFREIWNKRNEFDSQKMRLFTWLYQLTCVTLFTYHKTTAATFVKAAAVQVQNVLPVERSNNHMIGHVG